MPTVQVDFTDEEFPYLQEAVRRDPRGRDYSGLVRAWAVERLEHFKDQERQAILQGVNQDLQGLTVDERKQVKEILERGRERVKGKEKA